MMNDSKKNVLNVAVVVVAAKICVPSSFCGSPLCLLLSVLLTSLCAELDIVKKSFTGIRGENLSVCTTALSSRPRYVRVSFLGLSKYCITAHIPLSHFLWKPLNAVSLFNTAGPKGERSVISHCFSAVVQRAALHKPCPRPGNEDSFLSIWKTSWLHLLLLWDWKKIHQCHLFKRGVIYYSCVTHVDYILLVFIYWGNICFCVFFGRSCWFGSLKSWKSSYPLYFPASVRVFSPSIGV